MIGAAAVDALSALGAVTNNFGFYSLTLARGGVELECSCLGYETGVRKLLLVRDTVINVALNPSTEFLSAAVVTDVRNENGVRGSQMSAIEVPVNNIRNIPALAGEVDVIKALQLLPGVQSGTEGSAGLYVRGGGPDENLLLLDGVPLYNVNHLFGFFSVFNADAIKNVTLYKGSFPARFGDRLSSIVDVRMKDGNDREIHGSASIGLLSAKFNLEGPIVKGRTTFNISARRTYFDVLSMPLQAVLNKRELEDSGSSLYGGYNFYDLNAKLTHKFSDRDKLSLSFYMGDDVTYVDMMDEYSLSWTEQGMAGNPVRLQSEESSTTNLDWKWGNLVTALRWNHVFSPRLFMNAVVHYTRYRHGLSVFMDEKDRILAEPSGQTVSDEAVSARLDYDSGIDDIAGGVHFEFSPNTRHEVRFGLEATGHRFNPSVSGIRIEQSYLEEKAVSDTTFGDVPIRSFDGSLYVEDNFTITDWLKVNYGVRYSICSVDGHNYHSIEPRISARFLATDDLSFKMSYSEMSQYVHLLSNSSLALPMDLWVPVTGRIEPMRSRQAAAGVFYDLGQFEFSVEGYYKTMDNVLEYVDGATFLGSSAGWESKVAMGRGWSYGVELFVSRKFGKLTGWAGYTWSRSWRKFDREGNIINFGEKFPAKYDRIHDLSLTASYSITPRIDISATFVYGTGTSGSLEMERVIATYPDDFGKYGGYWPTGYLSGRNNYRMPDYHRADLGVNFHRSFKHGSRIINVSVYNAYNRINPFIVYQDTEYRWVDGEQPYMSSRPVLKKVSIFPILPSFSYTYNF